MSEKSMLEAINDALLLEMERDERVIVFGEDVGALGGVFRATDGLQEKFGADRVCDTPLAEGAIAGAALGMALAGRVPVAEIQFLGFAHQAFHQIADQISRYRYRTRGRRPLQLTIRAPFGGGVRTPELHSDALESHFASLPGLKVAMPATAADAKGMLLSAIRDPDPVLFCEPLKGYRLVRDEVPDSDYTVELGKARVARPGEDVTLISWSAGVHLCERTAELAAREDISCEVLDLRTLSPLDVESIVESVMRTGRCVVVQEAPLTGGFAAEIVSTVQENAFYSLESPVIRVASPDAPYPPFASMEDYYLPDETRVMAAIRKTLEG